jgi:hypothetical protein
MEFLKTLFYPLDVLGLEISIFRVWVVCTMQYARLVMVLGKKLE